ncbi:hypothetical protein DBR25_07505, partial [Chryseobacterium sp. HMWF001]
MDFFQFFRLQRPQILNCLFHSNFKILVKRFNCFAVSILQLFRLLRVLFLQKAANRISITIWHDKR